MHKQFYKLVDMLSLFIKKQDVKTRQTIFIAKTITNTIVLFKVSYARSTYKSGMNFGISHLVVFVFTNQIFCNFFL
jgi:hypothetical protein